MRGWRTARSDIGQVSIVWFGCGCYVRSSKPQQFSPWDWKC